MYRFYMGDVLLPITPEKLTLKINGANETITLINEGEVNLLKKSKLTDLEFDALIPAFAYSFAHNGSAWHPADHYLNYFEQLKVSKEPFQFTVIRELPDKYRVWFDTNMTVSLESYTIKEDVKEGFDLVVSFKLKQYKPFGTKIVKVSNPDETTTTTTTTTKRKETKSPKKDTKYTVKKGDCLWNIAKKFYGNGAKYTKIYNANKDKIKNPNLIYVGQVLIIPSA